MTEEKHAISLSHPMIVNCLTKGTTVLFFEIIACNTLNRHLVAKGQKVSKVVCKL